MVICRFFQQGDCRYGNKCWNEHQRGGNQGYSVTAQRQLFGGQSGGGSQKVSFSSNQNPYKWSAQDAQQGRGSTGALAPISATDIVKGLANEIAVTWEGGKMWPFTCLGFEKDLPSLPGFSDISQEELRLEAYEALKQGNIQPYVQKVASIFNDVNNQRQELKAPSMTLRQKLISFIEDCRRKKTSSSTGQVSLFSDNTTDSSPFGENAGATGGLFGTQPSAGMFAQSQTFGQTGNQSLFGGQTSTQSAFDQVGGTLTLFGQTQQVVGTVAGQTTLFGQTVTGQQPTGLFGQQSTQQSSLNHTQNPNTLFGKPNTSPFTGRTPQTVTPGFGSATPGTAAPSTFGSSAAASSSQDRVVPSGSVFGTQPTLPSQTNTTKNSSEESSVYTPVNKLTAEELAQFQAATFTLGLIPTKPPPRELC